MCGRGFGVWALVVLLLLDTAQIIQTDDVNATNTPEVEKTDTSAIQASDITEAGVPEEQKTDDQEAESANSEEYGDLFKLEHLGLEIPVKSAVHALNTNVLKQMLMKKLAERFGNQAKKNERKKRTS